MDRIGFASCDLCVWKLISSNFVITTYNVANEKDYIPLKKGDRYYRPKGLDRDFSYKFMADVDMQGSGVSKDGRFIKLVSTASELKKKIFRYSYVDGITGASGRYLRHGISIAVDPSVIKLGEQVCIEGFGVKSADDTGGGIKGFHIDLFQNISRKEALAFGKKRNVSVYRRK